MSTGVLLVEQPGMGALIQDSGRPGLRRFGVPPGGPMDPHAAGWCHRLLGNSPSDPLLELLMQGARLRVLQRCWIALAGADGGCDIPLWRTVRLEEGDTIHFPRNRSGVWTYLAVEGGFAVEPILGSASTSPRAGIGRPLQAGERLRRPDLGGFFLPEGVAGRLAPVAERRRYDSPPRFRVWPGPQWESFGEASRRAFFSQDWTVSARSDRTGYRLEGNAIECPSGQILSEPVRVGTIQVPPGGQPIVTLCDGPTVGGYAKLGWVEPEDLSWLVQCRPGQVLRFQPQAGNNEANPT